jgi:hypothetical protein
MSHQLPAGSTWFAKCDTTPELCAACGVVRPAVAEPRTPILKAWTGDHFVPFEGDLASHGPDSVLRWLGSYADWDLDAPGVGSLGSSSWPADNAASLVRGKLQPWTGQALPTQIFLPTLLPTPNTTDDGEPVLLPLVLYFHGGNDGPWALMEQQALAYQLTTNATYAAAFPFIAVMPCTECQRDGTMVPHGNILYDEGRPQFGQVGFTPRNLLRVDHVLAAA